MHMFYDGGYMVGMHGLWWVFWILVIGAVTYMAWGRGDRAGGDADSARETPQQVLQRRLASGEITPQQYDERKALLDRDAGKT